MNGKNRRGGPESGPDESSAHRQASEWLVLLESGDATDEDRARFEAWLAEDPGHREAYAALGETWGRLTVMRGRVGATGDIEPDPDQMMAALNAPPRPRRHRQTLIWAAAATVLVAAILGGLLLLPGDQVMPYRTEVGEHRTVSLPDGSAVELNTDTELLVQYTDDERRITMNRGEAFFEVVEDVGRPFIVTAGPGAIRAVGTGFAVRLKPADVVSVVVTEGAVEVIRPPADDSRDVQSAAAPPPFVLHRGQRAEYDRDTTRIERIAAEELERTQTWRRGLLVFEDASLAAVVAEVNRYTDTRLVIADPQISKLRLGGTFKTGNIEALLDVLEQGFGIRVERTGGDTIELHAAMPNSTRVLP